jgi:predicted DNA-binding transcriptional regulator AlpA
MDAGVAERIAEIFDRAKAEALALVSNAVPSVDAGTGLLCAQDVARRLQTSTQAVYRLSREGSLPAVRLSARRLRWTEEAVLSFISREDQKQSAQSKTLQLIQGRG